jgi:hypothetical protein
VHLHSPNHDDRISLNVYDVDHHLDGNNHRHVMILHEDCLNQKKIDVREIGTLLSYHHW